jgi:broad specificity phosphatase PhoE
MKLVIIRRAETNKDASLNGEPATPSPNGHAQIEELIKTCRTENVQAVIHSAKDRAVFTAEALALALNVPSIEQAGLEERNFGDWDQWEWPRIAAELDKFTAEERYTFVPPHGESWQQMEERLRSALHGIAQLPYESVAIVTHWGPIRALVPMLKKEPKESTLQLNVANGQAFIVEYDKSESV